MTTRMMLSVYDEKVYYKEALENMVSMTSF